MNNLSKSARQHSSAEHVHRSFDKNLNKDVVTISPGGMYITDQDEIITTVLGSCISVCVRDPMNKIGGMNHFMVPGSNSELASKNAEALLRLGMYSVPFLLQQLFSMGAEKQNLEIKVFGGGAIISSAGDIGNANIDFIRRFFYSNHLNIHRKDLGGELPRKISYFPQTGQVQLKRLRALHKRVIARREHL